MKVCEKDFLTAKECAEYLGIGLSSTRKFMKLIGAERKIGRICRYDRKVIKAYLDEHGGITPERKVKD